MFSRDGLHYFVAFLIVGGLLGLAWYKQPQTLTTEYKSEESCPYKTYHVGSAPDGGFEFRIERDAESCEGYGGSANNSEKTEKKPESLAEADLVAQQQMAHWTQWIGAFTAFGLFVLYVTFNETRKAVVETREIGAAQSQAYLVVQRVHFNFVAKDGKVGIQLFVNTRNTGQTPAQIIRYYVEGHVTFESGESAELSADMPLHSQHKTIGAGEAPNDSFDMGLWGLPKAFVNKIVQNADPTIHLAIFCRHDTVFKDRDYTTRREHFRFNYASHSLWGRHEMTRISWKDSEEYEG